MPWTRPWHALGGLLLHRGVAANQRPGSWQQQARSPGVTYGTNFLNQLGMENPIYK